MYTRRRGGEWGEAHRRERYRTTARGMRRDETRRGGFRPNPRWTRERVCATNGRIYRRFMRPASRYLAQKRVLGHPVLPSLLPFLPPFVRSTYENSDRYAENIVSYARERELPMRAPNSRWFRAKPRRDLHSSRESNVRITRDVRRMRNETNERLDT